MLRLILVRHGMTDWNAARRYQGHRDTGLSGVGLAQAKAVALRLRGEKIQAVYCSDLLRARQTAAIILGREPGADGDVPDRDSSVPCVNDPRLRELCFGRWEGLTYDEIGQAYPKELAIWQADPMVQAPPGGERAADLAGRVQEVLRGIVGAHGSETVLVVAHGGSLQALIALALGMTPRIPGQFRVEPGSVSELLISATGSASDWAATLTRLNDTSHLKDLPHGG